MQKYQGYHLSFRKDLEGRWNPQVPDGYDDEANRDSAIGEPSIARISIAGTIEGCVRAIYPNIYRFFEKDKLPHLDMYVYVPVGLSKRDIVPTSELTKKRYVWDAHITGEQWITKPVMMKRIGEIRIANPGKDNVLHTYPFDDKSIGELYDIRPDTVEYTVLNIYGIGESLMSRPLTKEESKLKALFVSLQTSQQLQEHMKEKLSTLLVTPSNYSEIDPAEMALAIHKVIESPEKPAVILSSVDNDNVYYSDETSAHISGLKELLRDKGVDVYDSVEDYKTYVEGIDSGDTAMGGDATAAHDTE
jgi:hypothetical protein